MLGSKPHEQDQKADQPNSKKEKEIEDLKK